MSNLSKKVEKVEESISKKVKEIEKLNVRRKDINEKIKTLNDEINVLNNEINLIQISEIKMILETDNINEFVNKLEKAKKTGDFSEVKNIIKINNKATV